MEREDLPSVPGAYALHFDLKTALAVPVARLGHPTLTPGTYVYAGSARGAGGIRARVARHLKPDKRPHWHVDYLSAVAVCTGVRVYPGGHECDLVADLLAAGATVPVPGFGSSDCRVCGSHLVRLP
jgi:Uri superfamily endonuclease